MSQRGRVCIFVLAQALTQAYQLYAIRILKWETSAIAVKLLLQRFRTIVARNGSPAKMKSRLWLNLNYDDFLSCHYIFVERQRKAKGGESWEIAHTDIMTSHLTFAFQGVSRKNEKCQVRRISVMSCRVRERRASERVYFISFAAGSYLVSST